jgi:hypothetical protein
MTIPFTCAECGSKFAPAEGGKCRACGRILCLQHLWETRNREGPICRECRRRLRQGPDRA